MPGTSSAPSSDDLFCHAIYATWHVVNRAYKKHLSVLGLTYPQYITLVLLWERDHRIVSEIASSLAMETSTLTPLLKRLEANGLVRRERSKQDERQVVVSLTPAGEALRSKAGAITACMIEDTGLDQQELETMIATLRKLGAGLSGRDEKAGTTTT